jgi:hypothetical protein
MAEYWFIFLGPLTAIVGVFIKHWKDIKKAGIDAFDGILDSVRDWTKRLVQWLVSFLPRRLVAAIKKGLGKVTNALKDVPLIGGVIKEAELKLTEVFADNTEERRRERQQEQIEAFNASLAGQFLRQFRQPLAEGAMQGAQQPMPETPKPIILRPEVRARPSQGAIQGAVQTRILNQQTRTNTKGDTNIEVNVPMKVIEGPRPKELMREASKQFRNELSKVARDLDTGVR